MGIAYTYNALNFLREYLAHPDQENGGGDAQLDGHEIRFVDHEHRGKHQKHDEGRGIVFRLFQVDKDREKEQNGHGQIDQKLRGQRILFQLEEGEDGQ